MDKAEKIKFVQSIQDGWKNGTVPQEEAIRILGQFANENAINNDAKLPGNFSIGELRNEAAKIQAGGGMLPDVRQDQGLRQMNNPFPDTNQRFLMGDKYQGMGGQQPSGGGEGGVPKNLAGQPGVPAAPQFASPAPNPNLTETEQRENDAKIMTPGYGNQGVNIQMQKKVAPWSGGQSPMVNNTSQPGPRDFRGDETGPFRGPPGAGLPTLQQDSMTQLGMMNREQAGPMDVPGARMAQQAGSGLLGGLRSAGKSAGGYMKSLFDDPQRMAMLQGGLSMMDPNSYYDKQGFGSVFTGLNKGLGAAQAGHAGVQSRRKAIADRQKVEAEAEYTRGGKSGESKAEFERVLAKFLTLPDGDARKPHLERRLNQLAPKPGQGGVDYNSRDMSGYTWKELVPKSDEMQTSLINFTNLMNSTVDSDLGITFGPGTDFKAHVYAVLSESFGQDMGEEGVRLANTRLYMSAMGGQVAEAITAFGAGTGLSDADRKFAEQMVGKNPGDFTEESLRKLLIYNEGAMRGKLAAHNQRLKDMYGGNPPAGTLRKLPTMSKNLKRHMVEQMKDGNYTVGGEAVDPNKPPPGWKDEYEDQWKLLAKKSAEKIKGKPTTSRITKVKNNG